MSFKERLKFLPLERQSFNELTDLFQELDTKVVIWLLHFPLLKTGNCPWEIPCVDVTFPGDSVTKADQIYMSI